MLAIGEKRDYLHDEGPSSGPFSVIRTTQPTVCFAAILLNNSMLERRGIATSVSRKADW